jgi:histone H3/H4
MRTMDFPCKPVGRIARQETGMRMTESAVRAVRNAVLHRAEDAAREIVSVSRHSRRKTVLRGDVAFVTKREVP